MKFNLLEDYQHSISDKRAIYSIVGLNKFDKCILNFDRDISNLSICKDYMNISFDEVANEFAEFIDGSVTPCFSTFGLSNPFWRAYNLKFDKEKILNELSPFIEMGKLMNLNESLEEYSTEDLEKVIQFRKEKLCKK